MSAADRAFAERLVEIDRRLNDLYAELTVAKILGGPTASIDRDIAQAWLDKRACAVDWREHLPEVATPRSPSPGDGCRLLGDYKVEHVDCEDHAPGTITDVRTGKAVSA